MKKLMYLFVAATMLAFMACGGSGETATEEAPVAIEEAVEQTQDTAVVEEVAATEDTSFVEEELEATE